MGIDYNSRFNTIDDLGSMVSTTPLCLMATMFTGAATEGDTFARSCPAENVFGVLFSPLGQSGQSLGAMSLRFEMVAACSWQMITGN